MITITARDLAGNTATQTVNVNVQTPSNVKDVWALQQSSVSGLNTTLRSQIAEAMALSCVTGFSLRFKWIDYSTQLLDIGEQLAGNKKFSIRFMAGRHTPQSTILAGPHYTAPAGEGFPEGESPSPFYPDGSPNDVFEAAYENFANQLADQMVARGHKLLHLSWYAQNWAELNHGAEVRAVPGYTYQNWLNAHKRLIDIGHRVWQSHPSLIIEWPVSGYGPISGNTPAAKDLTNHMISRFGQDSPNFRTQMNGWGISAGPAGVWGSNTTTTENQLTTETLNLAAKHGIQSIQPHTDWAQPTIDNMIAELVEWDADYCEHYIPTIRGASGQRWNAPLLAWRQS